MPEIKAVLFDLDDTLFDHRRSSRKSLLALKNKYSCFTNVSLDELELEHLKLLNEIHISSVLTGELTIEEARNKRYRRLFSHFGLDTDAGLIDEARKIYSDIYRSDMRAVPGAIELLGRLKKKIKIGIVSNNFGSEQKAKIDVCGLEGYFDVLVTSVEVGITKPAPGIFLLALQKLGCAADEAVLIGDSWESDIKGASNAGIRAVWFNRYGFERPENPSIFAEIKSLIPAEDIERLIFSI